MQVVGPLLHERDLYLAWSLKRSKAVNGRPDTCRKHGDVYKRKPQDAVGVTKIQDARTSFCYDICRRAKGALMSSSEPSTSSVGGAVDLANFVQAQRMLWA